MTSYWQWMSVHWFWGGLLSFTLALAFITMAKRIFSDFLKIFHKPQPPKIIIKIEGREVTGEVDEEVASVLQSVSQQLSSDTSRWDRLLDGEE